MSKLKICILTLSICLLSVINALAQATPTSKLGWLQDAPSLTEAQTYTYRYYPDSVTTGTVLTSVVCTGTASPFSCSAQFPTFTNGNHRITITAVNAIGESVGSIPLDFSFTDTATRPTAPRNLFIINP